MTWGVALDFRRMVSGGLSSAPHPSLSGACRINTRHERVAEQRMTCLVCGGTEFVLTDETGRLDQSGQSYLPANVYRCVSEKPPCCGQTYVTLATGEPFRARSEANHAD